MPVAGIGPYDDQNIFARILRGDIPCKKVFEDAWALAFDDIAPQAPVHILVIPRKVIPTLNDVTPADAELIGGLFLTAAKLMKDAGHTDYRTVFNCGPGAQQSVFHLHLHVLGGRKFNWPPG